MPRLLIEWLIVRWASQYLGSEAQNLGRKLDHLQAHAGRTSAKVVVGLGDHWCDGGELCLYMHWKIFIFPHLSPFHATLSSITSLISFSPSVFNNYTPRHTTKLCPFVIHIYASPSSGEAYRDRQLTINFELWVEIFCVPTCFHVRIPKPCLSVPRVKKSP